MREYLKNLRKQNNFSQEYVAEKIGIKQNYYSMIENGERQKDMDISLAQKLSEVLGVPIDYILENERKEA